MVRLARRLALVAALVAACGAFAPSPPPKQKTEAGGYVKFARHPLVEYPGAIPATGWWHEPGEHWNNRPTRKTKFWQGVGGIHMCDDPDCMWCSADNYEQVCDDPPARIRR